MYTTLKKLARPAGDFRAHRLAPTLPQFLLFPPFILNTKLKVVSAFASNEHKKMSGFENMRSEYTAKLHPAIDPNDKFDSIFIGVTRKRRTVPVYSEQCEERGKKQVVEMRTHDPTALGQLGSMYQQPTFSGSVKETRFGAGFSRRPADVIASDRLRVLVDTEHAERRAEAAIRRRDVAANRNKTYNPITGKETALFEYFKKDSSHVVGHSDDRLSKVFNWPDNRTSHVFPKVAEPTPMPQHMLRSSPSPAGLSKRQERLVNEGLAKQKDWSVAQQMKCLDGFVLPKA